MADYGVTDSGFVLKRMDKIIEEIHDDLTSGLGFNTRLTRPSVLDTIVTTFAGQIASLWEVAQESYYSKYVSTATGKNLDNAVQYGGIVRKGKLHSIYPLYCTGDDGTLVRSGTIVATDTTPEKRLTAMNAFTISREMCNSAVVIIAAVQNDTDYTVGINGQMYVYHASSDADEAKILEGLKNTVAESGYTLSVEDGELLIKDTVSSRNNVLFLSENLTTTSVVSIAKFVTQDYGEISIPNGLITKLITNIPGFKAVTNELEPKLGRNEETDVELRQSYLAKSAARSNTMIGSIISELLTNVDNVESASGYENDSDTTDENGLPPHSIEIIVEGGDDTEIANAIFLRKAGGIQTYGDIVVNCTGSYGDTVAIHFNRPEYLYTFVKVVLHGDKSKLPVNYETLTKDSILEDLNLKAGARLLVQLMSDGIYSAINGLTYVDIKLAYSSDKAFKPTDADYKAVNIICTSRQMIVGDRERIEVEFDADS